MADHNIHLQKLFPEVSGIKVKIGVLALDEPQRALQMENVNPSVPFCTTIVSQMCPACNNLSCKNYSLVPMGQFLFIFNSYEKRQLQIFFSEWALVPKHRLLTLSPHLWCSGSEESLALEGVCQVAQHRTEIPLWLGQKATLSAQDLLDSKWDLGLFCASISPTSLKKRPHTKEKPI